MKNKRKYSNLFFNIFDKYPREYILLAFFILCGLIIIFSIFSYTYINHEYYKKLADKQQLGKIIIPVNRGTIYASTPSGKTTLATSLSLDDLAVDPTVEGDKNKLSLYVRDIVYKQICSGKSLKECYNNMLKFTKVLEIPDFKLEKDFIKELILKEVIKRLSKDKVTSVVLGENINPDNLLGIEGLKLPGITIYGTNVYANPEEILNTKLTAESLLPYLNMELEDLEPLLKKRDIKYVPIISKLSITLSEEIEEYMKEERLAINKKILDPKKSVQGFIILTGNPSRYYPENTLGSSIVGFLDQDGIGRYGIEGFFNDDLKGNNGKVYARVDVKGRTIDSLNKDDSMSKVGVDITLTVDRNIQKRIEEILENGVKRYKANRGSIVVMNPKTGNVLAMANYPTYNLNDPAGVYEIEKIKEKDLSSEKDYKELKKSLLGKTVLVEDSENGEEFFYDGDKIKLRLAKREELGDPLIVKYKYKNNFGAGVYQNGIVSDLYEPGSIMKAVTVAIGLDSGEINRYDMYQDNMEVTVDAFTIHNVGKECAGYKSFNNALIYSCNVGMIRIIQKVGRALHYNYLKDFGFTTPSDIELSGEVYSALPTPEKWPRSKGLTMSYGMGISVTPLQMATAYSVLANGGVYVKPNIIKSITGVNGKTIEFKPERLHRVIKEETSKVITSMLVDSVENGFAVNGKVEGYNLAGKTGTAQIAYKGGYEDGAGGTIGSFAGYGPAEDPQFVVIVKLNRPRTNMYGGETSAHLFAETSRYLLDYFGIPSKNLKSNNK